MTKQQFEEEISKLLNQSSTSNRKEVESDLVYIQCVKAGDMKNAYDTALKILHGNAKNLTEMRRLVKRRRRKEMEPEFI